MLKKIMETKTFVERQRRDEPVVISDQKELIPKPPSPIKRFLKSQKCYILSAFLVITVTMPLLMLYFYNDARKFPPPLERTCLVDREFRIPCGKVNISKSACYDIHCCYEEEDNECFHYIPSAYNYKSIGGVSAPKLPKNQYGWPIFDNVHITTKEVDENIVYISVQHRGQAPQTLNTPKKYYIKEYTENMAVEVYRDSGERILTTSMGPLIASQNYWEWAIHLTTNNLFGFGELLLNETETITKVIYRNRNDHNTLPIFLAEQNGLFHGLHVVQNGPLEVSILPSKLILLRSLAGDHIDLRVFLGPTPKDVMLQMRSLYFKNPQVTSRWVLGSHLCSDFHVPIEDVFTKYKDPAYESIYDSDCIHSNLTTLIYRKMKTDEIKNAVANIKAKKKRFVLSLPPQIPINTDIFDVSKAAGVLFKRIIDDVWKGRAFNTDVAYVDFTAKNIMQWKDKLLEAIKNVTGPDIDGLALIQNWPTDDKYVMPNSTTNFPYLTEEIMWAMRETLPWNAPNFENVKHMIIHNEYGSSQLKTMRDDNVFTMSSSYQLPLEDNDINAVAIIENMNTTWTNLKNMIKINLNHGLFANPLIATPVCGSNFYKGEDKNKENICLRWYIVAATMPMLRATSHLEDFDSKHVQNIAKDALQKREMLTYYYYNYISKNEPLARPMFYDFYADNETFVLDEQYMIGDALLTAHPVVPNAANLRVYLPECPGMWYDFFGGTVYNTSGWNDIFIVESDWTMFIKAGTIVPLKDAPRKDAEAKKTFSFVVALNCSSEEPTGLKCNAEGIIKFESNLEIKANETSLTLSNIDAIRNEIGCPNGGDHPTAVKNLNIFGLKEIGIVEEINFDLCGIEAEYTHKFSFL